MRFRFFLWASADLGVRFSNVEISFCSSGYIENLQGAQADRRPLECTSSRSRSGLKLEVELQSKLYQSRIAGLLYLAEGGVAEIPIGIHEHRLVEQIEDICPKLK